MKQNLENKKIILFDGVCNLCNNAINFVIDKDKKDIFRFAPLQSEIGKKLLEERGIDSSQTDSIVLIDPGNAYYLKSSAALHIAKELSGVYTIMGIFLYLPEALRDAVYDLVARKRYKWYGKRENCRIPTPELQKKFLA